MLRYRYSGAEVERCRGAEVQRCRVAAEKCRVTELQSFAEVQRF